MTREEAKILILLDAIRSFKDASGISSRKISLQDGYIDLDAEPYVFSDALYSAQLSSVLVMKRGITYFIFQVLKKHWLPC